MDAVYVRQRRLEENIPAKDVHDAPSAGEKDLSMSFMLVQSKYMIGWIL